MTEPVFSEPEYLIPSSTIRELLAASDEIISEPYHRLGNGEKPLVEEFESAYRRAYAALDAGLHGAMVDAIKRYWVERGAEAEEAVDVAAEFPL